LLPDIQFTLASVVYFTLSKLFPAHETMLEHAILERESLSDNTSVSASDEKKGGSGVDDVKIA
jgi:hypothetical protein